MLVFIHACSLIGYILFYITILGILTWEVLMPPYTHTHEDGVYLTRLMSMLIIHQINSKRLITSSFNVATTGGNLCSLCALPSRVKFSLKQNKSFWVNSP